MASSAPHYPGRCWLAVVLMVGMLATAACAQAPSGAEVARDALLQTVRWQLALEREGFSPGVIDGKPGPKTTMAMTEFQRDRGLAVTGQADADTAAALEGIQTQTIGTYAIQQSDAAMVTGPFAGWVAKSQARYLGYESLEAAVAERFHCSRGLLGQLNPGVNLAALTVGDTIIVPAVGEPKTAQAARLEIDLSRKTIRVFDSSGKVVALFHCSIAADPAKRPAGRAEVTGVSPDPWYTFDPAGWPEVHDVHQKLMVPPGPRNPVGLCWVALNLPGYGIHGTPNPELIGKTGSHGCFRLTNWDAVRLGGMVHAGVPVDFVRDGAGLAGAPAPTPATPAAAPARPGRPYFGPGSR